MINFILSHPFVSSALYALSCFVFALILSMWVMKRKPEGGYDLKKESWILKIFSFFNLISFLERTKSSYTPTNFCPLFKNLYLTIFFYPIIIALIIMSFTIYTLIANIVAVLFGYYPKKFFSMGSAFYGYNKFKHWWMKPWVLVCAYLLFKFQLLTFPKIWGAAKFLAVSNISPVSWLPLSIALIFVVGFIIVLLLVKYHEKMKDLYDMLKKRYCIIFTNVNNDPQEQAETE